MTLHKSSKQWLCRASMVVLFMTGCATKQDITTSQHTAAPQPEAAAKQQATQPEGPALLDIRVSQAPEKCSVAVSTSTPPTYTIFKLTSPDRLIIDLPDMQSAEVPDVINVNNPYIDTISSHLVEDGQRSFLRVEMGLRQNCSYNAINSGNTVLINLSASADAPPTAVQASPPASKPAGTAAESRALELEKINFGHDDSSFIVTFVANRNIDDYRSFTLKKPNRLVIDLPGASTTLFRSMAVAENPFIDKIRVAKKSDKVRIVVDLKGARFPLYQMSQADNALTISLEAQQTQTTAVTAPVAAKVQPETTAQYSEGPRYTGERISLDFKDADIKNILRLIADISGLNIIVSDKVTGNITMKLDKIPWDEALDIILQTNNLDKIKTGTVTRIDTIDQIKKINEQKIQAKKSQQDVVDLAVKTFDISYAKATDLATFIKQMKVLSKRGSVTPFKLTNKLTVQDIPDNIATVEDLILEQDIPTRQVLIEARIVQSNPGYVKELGVQWGGTYNTTKDGGVAKDGADISLTGAAGGGNNVVNLAGPANGAITFGYLKDNINLDVTLTAMENEDKLKIISNPRVLGLDNKQARIKQGVALPYLKLSEQGVTSTEFKDAVLELTVTPKITPAETVSLHVYVTKNQKSALTGAGNEPGIDIREVETDLLIASGKTIVIGGIYETTETHNIKKVPLFGDIPVVGYFFRNEKTEDLLTELLVFITVTVVETPNTVAKGI